MAAEKQPADSELPTDNGTLLTRYVKNMINAVRSSFPPICCKDSVLNIRSIRSI